MGSRMKEVAERAGVSVTTVSHVINKTRYVSPETRKLVLQAARELNFYKDAHARRLATGRSDFLGIVVSDIENPFFPEIIKNFEAEALKRGFDLLLVNTNYDSRRAETAVRRLIENRVRGVAVMTSELASTLTEELSANQVPVVFLDLGSPGAYVSNLRVDYSQGISEAMQHLHDLGHRDIRFVAGPRSLRSARIREEVFLTALRHWGLPSDQIIEGNHKIDGGLAAGRAVLTGDNLPTAILCSNDLTAIGVIQALEDGGLRVPEHVSVVGFDDIHISSVLRPSLTTVNLPRNRLGKLAFEALRKMLKTKCRRGRIYTVETHLVVRNSTAGARKQLRT
jgi:DNA-binding LacI/PurR family transcriptional regulator